MLCGAVLCRAFAVIDAALVHGDAAAQAVAISIFSCYITAVSLMEHVLTRLCLWCCAHHVIAVLCHAMLCCAVLCCAVLCHAVFRFVILLVAHVPQPEDEYASLQSQVGYQFVMRWVNNHIYFMKKKSPLGKRILEQVRRLPFENSDKFVDQVINKTCRPVGYFPVTDPQQFRDFYNFCLFQLIKASEENKGDDLDNILFDQPLVSFFSEGPF